MSAEASKKILVVFGTRPEAIKMAPVIKALENEPDRFRVITCVTGQHREMLDEMLRIFELRPHIDLRLMQHQPSRRACVPRTGSTPFPKRSTDGSSEPSPTFTLLPRLRLPGRCSPKGCLQATFSSPGIR